VTTKRVTPVVASHVALLHSVSLNIQLCCSGMLHEKVFMWICCIGCCMLHRVIHFRRFRRSGMLHRNVALLHCIPRTNPGRLLHLAPVGKGPCNRRTLQL